MNTAGNETLLTKAVVRMTADGAARLGLHIRPAGTIVFPKRGGAIATNKKRLLGQPSAYDLNTMGVVPAESVGGILWWWFQGLDLSQLDDGSTVPQINHGDIAPLPVPVIPEREAAELVRRVAESLALRASVVAACANVRDRSTQLNQSILANAFRGELVPQDPNDEPASALLERIRTERAGSASKAPKRGRKAKSG